MRILILLTTFALTPVYAEEFDPFVQIEPDAYGLGVSQDQYGRDVKLDPDPFVRIEKEDAYGPGVHMDQYGRPVTVQPRRPSSRWQDQ